MSVCVTVRSVRTHTHVRAISWLLKSSDNRSGVWSLGLALSRTSQERRHEVIGSPRRIAARMNVSHIIHAGDHSTFNGAPWYLQSIASTLLLMRLALTTFYQGTKIVALTFFISRRQPHCCGPGWNVWRVMDSAQRSATGKALIWWKVAVDKNKYNHKVYASNHHTCQQPQLVTTFQHNKTS